MKTLDGEDVMVEWKRKPWKLTIKIHVDNRGGHLPSEETCVETFVDATMKSGAIVSLLLQKTNLQDTEHDYGLYANYSEDHSYGEWLDDALPLTTYNLRQKVFLDSLIKLVKRFNQNTKAYCMLEVKQKPNRLLIKFNDETMDWYNVDFNNTVYTLVESICKKRGVSTKYINDYGLFLPPSSPTTSYRQSRYWTLSYGNNAILWLDNARKLSSYPLSDGVCFNCFPPL